MRCWHWCCFLYRTAVPVDREMSARFAKAHRTVAFHRYVLKMPALALLAKKITTALIHFFVKKDSANTRSVRARKIALMVLPAPMGIVIYLVSWMIAALV